MTRALNCTEVQGHLPLFVGGDLEESLAAWVTAHTDACSTCRAQADGLERARRNLGLLAMLTPPAPGVWSSVRAELASEGRLSVHPKSARRTVAWPWVAGLAAAAAWVAIAVWSRGSGVESLDSSKAGEVVAQPSNEALPEILLPAMGLRRVAPEDSLLQDGDLRLLDLPFERAPRSTHGNAHPLLVGDDGIR